MGMKDEGKEVEGLGRMVKVSVAFEVRDYDWAVERAAEAYGRRGIGMYIRRLVREDRDRERVRGVVGDGIKEVGK